MSTFRADGYTGVNGSSYTLLTGDTLFVTRTGLVESFAAATVSLVGAGTIFVDGSIWSNANNSAISGGTNNGAALDVSATGRIFANTGLDFSAVFLQGQSTVNTAGRITNTQGHALIVAGGSTVSNTGDIAGGQLGVAFNPGATGSSLFNSGVISGGNAIGTGIDLAHGIYIGALNTDVVNEGTIISHYDGGHAIFVLEGGANIENSGQITAMRGTGIDASGTGGGLRVLNTGTITGGTFAIAGGGGLDVVTNLGTIATGQLFGEVMSLGGGFDLLQNEGRITGTIFMGTEGDAYIGRFSTAGANVAGQAGDDTLTGGAFSDTLTGGGDDDSLTGNAGDDVFLDTTGNDNIFGGAGDDLIDDREGANFLAAGAGDDTIMGGADSDTIYGGLGDDQISDQGGGNVVYGGAGDDMLQGNNNADTLFGGAGEDTMVGSEGDDVYGINAATDVVLETGLTSTADRVESSYVSLDLARYAGVEHAALYGTASLNLTGSAGQNVLTGNDGANRIAGGAAADVIDGRSGSDLITGGTGRDLMTGGAGADVFVLLSAAETGLTATTRDSITDFAVGVDDMRMIFMASFIGAAGFTAAGQVRYVAATGILSGSTDADAASEWQVQMATGLVLTAADFVF